MEWTALSGKVVMDAETTRIVAVMVIVGVLAIAGIIALAMGAEAIVQLVVAVATALIDKML